jgi:peptidoglycan/xylan/chitin deacetylase (PgdA/CDA1 family)
MYHYVRKSEPDLPSFRYLHVDDFAKQLDYFQERYGFVDREAFHDAVRTGEPAKGVVLTFDDGLADHYSYVYPLLKKRGLWGLFYVPSGPYRRKALLDVHRVHMLLGHLGGDALLQTLYERIEPDMLIEGSAKFGITTYLNQQNDQATTEAKQLINYYVRPTFKESLLADIMQNVFGSEADLAARFYLTREQIREMADGGMGIGSHGQSHTLLSHLDANAQREEITESFAFLRAVCGEATDNSFCYPYGGDQSFNRDTVEVLKDCKISCAFSVEPRPIDAADLGGRYRLPRYDCNMFKHGAASLG